LKTTIIIIRIARGDQSPLFQREFYLLSASAEAVSVKNLATYTKILLGLDSGVVDTKTDRSSFLG